MGSPSLASLMEQHHDQLDKLEEDNFYSALKLQKYGFGLKLKISGFVSFLAWTGILVSALGILTSMEFISDTKIISHGQPTTSYVLGVVGILTSAVWMGIHLTLRKRNLNKDFEGIKKILKIKCYITGSLEIVFSTLGMMTILMYMMVHYDYLMFSTQSMLINITQGGIVFLDLVFACCKIHGVRKDNNRFINAYIVFKLVCLVASIALGIFSLVYLQTLLQSSEKAEIFLIFGLVLIFFLFLYVYYMGALVVLYNFNHHFDSKTNYENLAFINPNFLEGNTIKSQA